MNGDNRQKNDELRTIREWYQNSEFRDAMRRDPKEALRAFIGIDLPEQLTVHVHQETERELHVVHQDMACTRSDMAESWKLGLSDLFVIGQHSARTRAILSDQDPDRRKQRLAELLDTRFPEDLAIHVHEETQQDLHICTPMACDVESRSELDLSINPRDFWIRQLLDLVAIAHRSGAPYDERPSTTGST